MESALYSIYARVVDVSEIERVRFLIQKQRMRKYRTTSYINEVKELWGNQKITSNFFGSECTIENELIQVKWPIWMSWSL